MENNGQWIELQPLYGNQNQFVHGLPQNYEPPNNANQESSPNGQKSCEPDPYIEAIVDGVDYPELKQEINNMIKLVLFVYFTLKNI